MSSETLPAGQDSAASRSRRALTSDPLEGRGSKPKGRKRKKAELVEELDALRQRLAELEGVEAKGEQAQAILRDSEARFQSVLDTCPDSILEVDLEAKLLSANRGLPELPSELLAGATVYDYFPEGVRKSLAHHLARVIETADEDRFEMRYEARDGATLSFEVRVGPVFQDGVLVALSIVSTDVTQRRRAEEALGEVASRFDRLAQLVAEVFWLYDPVEKKRIYVSPAFERIWQRPADLGEDVLGGLDSIHAGDRERVREAFAAGVAGGEFDETYRIVRTDGETRWIHERSVAPRDEGVSVAGIAEDVTERKRAEEVIQRYQKEIGALKSQVSRVEKRKGLDGARVAAVRDRLTASKTKLAELGESLKYTRWAPTVEELSTLVEKVIEETRSLE